MEFDTTQKGTTMGGTCDCIGYCEHAFQAQISNLNGFLYVIKNDDDHIFTFRHGSESPRRYTLPPRKRWWSFSRTIKRPYGHGMITTWDLKSDEGEDTGYCYISGGRLGLTEQIVNKSTATEYDPDESCDQLETIVHCIQTDALNPHEQVVVHAALLRLITINPA